jgi:hypothetical protein
VSLFLKKTAWFSRSLPASRRKAAKVVLGCDSVRASAQVTMSEALNTEVAIKDAPGSGKNQEAATSGRHVGRTGLRDVVLRRARLRRAWKHTGLFWRALSSFTLSLSAMITVVVVATLLVQNLTRRTIAIEPVSVPKELAENGYTPDVAARRLRDAVNVFVAQAQTSMKGPEIALRGDVPDIVVPTVGISIDSIAAAIRGFLHSNLHQSISGEFTITNRLLWLRLRIDGREFYSSATGGAPERPDELLAAAVPEFFEKVQPYIVASYLSKKDPAQALKIAKATVARLPKGMRTSSIRISWKHRSMEILRATLRRVRPQCRPSVSTHGPRLPRAPETVGQLRLRQRVGWAGHRWRAWPDTSW